MRKSSLCPHQWSHVVALFVTIMDWCLWLQHDSNCVFYWIILLQIQCMAIYIAIFEFETAKFGIWLCILIDRCNISKNTLQGTLVINVKYFLSLYEKNSHIIDFRGKEKEKEWRKKQNPIHDNNGVQCNDLYDLYNLSKLEVTTNRHHLPHIYFNMNKYLNIEPTSKEYHLMTRHYKIL